MSSSPPKSTSLRAGPPAWLQALPFGAVFLFFFIAPLLLIAAPMLFGQTLFAGDLLTYRGTVSNAGTIKIDSGSNLGFEGIAAHTGCTGSHFTISHGRNSFFTKNHYKRIQASIQSQLHPPAFAVQCA